VPRRDLQISGQPGVYWVGVHVLGGNQDGRDGVADGRARTFMPLMKPGSPRTSMSLVMPLKGRVVRNPNGSLNDYAAWKRSLSPDGRFDRLLGLSKTANLPFTWLVDPAVVDAAESVARDNPSLDTSATGGGGSSPSGTASPSPDASASPSPSPSTGVTPQGGKSAAAQSAASWLKQLQQQGRSRTIMTVPYGDLDVSAALGGRFRSLVRRASALSSRTMHWLGVPSSPVIAPPNGYLAPRALRSLGASKPVLMSDTAFPAATSTVLHRHRPGHDGPHVVLQDSAAGSGGPAPSYRFSALAVRQRILSEAALHARSPDRSQTLVVSTPQHWNPGSDWQASRFFLGLQVPWLDMIDIPGLLSGPAGAHSPVGGHPEYPLAQRRAEVPTANLRASRKLSLTGGVFSALLARNSTVDDDLAKQGVLASSVHIRSHPRHAAHLAWAATRRIQAEMGKVRIEGPSFVTMSSESGAFAVTIINGLDESVNVGIRADADNRQLSIAGADPVRLGPGQRASVRLRATTRDIGVHTVTLIPVNDNGHPLGNLTSFNVRSSQVGRVIWVVIGAGGAVLLVTIVVRIVRRVSRRRTRRGPLLKEPGA
jgi:hypothetical protein